jgi:hypothetical protein
MAQEMELKRVRKSRWRTYFGRGIRQTVQGGTLARRRLANECDERIARHFFGLQSRQGVESSYAVMKVLPEGFDERHNVVSGHEGCGSEWMWLSLLLV